MDQLQVVAVAVALGPEQVAVQFEAVEHIPVQRRAVLQGLVDALCRNADDSPRVHQVIGQHACRQAVICVALPVAQQAALPPQVQVVAPGGIGAAPVAGFVNECLAARGHLAVLDQADFHFIDAPG
ncbi:hypothetical protein D3C76_1165620 [compost metagenome]